MLNNLKEFYMAVFYYFSKSVTKMIPVGLNSAVDAKMIQVITLKKKPVHNTSYNSPITHDQFC